MRTCSTVNCMSSPEGCLSRTNINVSPKHIEILFSLVSRSQDIILCCERTLCSHWPCAFPHLDMRLPCFQSMLAHSGGLPSSSGLCLDTTSFPGRSVSWVSADYIWTGLQPWCLMGQQSCTSCYLSARARLENSTAHFGLSLPVEIKLWWGLMPGQVSAQHRSRTWAE